MKLSVNKTVTLAFKFFSDFLRISSVFFKQMFAIHQRSNNHYLPLLSRGLKWDELQITPSLPRVDGCWRTLVSLALTSSSATRKKAKSVF